MRRQDNAAAKWLMAASRAGHPTAMNELAQLYVTGRGVDRDLNAAVQWYRKSAELGNPESAAALARGPSTSATQHATTPRGRASSTRTTNNLRALTRLVLSFSTNKQHSSSSVTP